MKTYTFSAQIEPGNKVTIPEDLAKNIPDNSSVSIILRVTEAQPPASSSPLIDLETLITEIKATPSAAANIQSESGLLASHLAESVESDDDDSTFDVEAWNETWDQLEQQMDAEALVDESTPHNPENHNQLSVGH